MGAELGVWGEEPVLAAPFTVTPVTPEGSQLARCVGTLRSPLLSKAGLVGTGLTPDLTPAVWTPGREPGALTSLGPLLLEVGRGRTRQRVGLPEPPR